jgi:CHASE3 domain sensor protein
MEVEMAQKLVNTFTLLVFLLIVIVAISISSSQTPLW